MQGRERDDLHLIIGVLCMVICLLGGIIIGVAAS